MVMLMIKALFELFRKIYRKLLPLGFRLNFEKFRLSIRDKRLLDRMNRYFNSHDTEKRIYREELEFLNKVQSLVMIPYDFSLEIDQGLIEVKKDYKKELLYVTHKDRHLYFPKNLSAERIQNIYKSLCAEQNSRSPHCYFTDQFTYSAKDTFFDVGCAEGIVSLEVIETVNSVVLFEGDLFWIEALSATFEPWKDRVTIVPKYVSDHLSDSTTTIDQLLYGIQGPILIKIDVEGNEAEVLNGAVKILEKDSTRVVCCTYHKYEDSERFRKFFQTKGYQTEYSRGFMLLQNEKFQKPPFFRKGLIRSWK